MQNGVEWGSGTLMVELTRKPFLLWALLACVVLLSGHGISGDAEAAARMPERLRTAAAKLVPLHRVKVAPGPNDWLANHHEDGQTADQYRRSNPNRPTKARTTFYVQPIGEFTPAQLKLTTATADLLARYYNVPTKVLGPLSLDVIPAKARRMNGGEQILTSYVLDKVLKPRRPANAVAVLGLMTSDLWPGEGWNFVFGEASLSDRVGVWSIARYGNLEGERANAGQVYRRTFLVAVHETGHMLGMPHCTAFECTMNGSNSLIEADRAPMWLCPECAQKVWWACRADPITRYKSLVEFAKLHDLKAEADFWQRSADRLSAKERAE
ncbi:MAG TPA: archaemetzincin [Planctomycetaceae bacterium]|jgi:archaemetzincin|nr:archaemetzincin [Planctomycetaceae bacterium]